MAKIEKDFMFDLRIWPVPIKSPFSKYLGIGITSIDAAQIPYDSSLLEPGDIIANENNERLIYVDNHYRIYPHDPDIYLVNWFTKWEKWGKISKDGIISKDPIDRKDFPPTIHIFTNLQMKLPPDKPYLKDAETFAREIQKYTIWEQNEIVQTVRRLLSDRRVEDIGALLPTKKEYQDRIDELAKSMEEL